MDPVGKLCTTFLLVIFCLSVEAQQPNGAAFDPTPVNLPDVKKTTLRPVTNVDLLKLRDFHGSRISPDGKWVAFVLGQAVSENNSYRSGLFIISTEKGAKPVSLGSAGPPHWDDINQWWAEDPQWSADSRFIYYRMKRVDTWQVWKWDREGGAPAQVTHLGNNIQSFQLEGNKLSLTVEKPSAINRKQLTERGVLYDGSFDAGSGRPLLDQVVAGQPIETDAWIHDLAKGQDRRSTKEEEEAYNSWDYTPHGAIFSKKEIEDSGIFRVKISPDGKGVLYQRWVQDPSESSQLVYPLFSRPIEGGDSTPLTPDVYYPEEFWWSANSQEIFYSQYSDTDAGDTRPSKLMAVPVTGGKARTVLDSAGYQHNYSMDRSGHFLACTHENNTTPTELRLIDLSSGESRTLVDVNPEFQNIKLNPARRIDVSNKYGDHFWGHLVLPPDYEPGKHYPLIFTTYRDGESFLRGAAGDEYPIQVFAANGFAVLNFDFGRVRNSKSDDFETKVLFWASPVDGMEAAIEKLSDMDIIDRSRIGITGWSHGDEMVAYAISHTSVFRAAIASGPGRDPIQYILGGDFFRADFSRSYHLESPDGESRTRWQRVSAALNATRISAPLLINSGEGEYIHCMQLVSALRELKKPVEMFIYSNELHDKNQPTHRLEIYQRNVDWMNFWLQDKVDTDPAKAEQYKRWQEFRTLQQRDTGTGATR